LNYPQFIGTKTADGKRRLTHIPAVSRPGRQANLRPNGALGMMTSQSQQRQRFKIR
jgi:hypothetical protein